MSTRMNIDNLSKRTSCGGYKKYRGCSFRHLEFGLIDTSGMSEQQRREISYTVVQSQCAQQSSLQSNNSRLDDTDSSLPRYDDLKTACNLHNHPPPQLEDETGSVVIV